MAGANQRLLCGWRPDPVGVQSILADRTTPGVVEWTGSLSDALTPKGGLPTRQAAPEDYLDGRAEDGDWQQDAIIPDVEIDWAQLRDDPPILLYEPLLHFQPDWRRGAQGIGDCVSWGWELGCTIAAAVQSIQSRGEYAYGGEYATEPIYGGSRVEARGRKRGGWSDGSYGGAAAKWVTKWGALRRYNYSHVNGANEEYDLRSYSSKKAKQWGNYGCGGKDDADKLDEHARDYPVKHCVLTSTFDAAALAIANGYPVPVCSGYGFGSRGSNGFAPRRGSWSHCMGFIGVRFDKPGLLLANSWGNSWGDKNPHYPNDMPNNVQKCTAWVEPKHVNGMLRGRDSFAVGHLKLKRQPLVWLDATSGLGRGKSKRKSIFA